MERPLGALFGFISSPLSGIISDVKYTVLLYYKYIDVGQPEKERQAQLNICRQLGLKGRILIGSEGINGTVAGTKEATDQYISYMNGHESFRDIDFKVDQTDIDSFPRLRVKTRPEIVALNSNDEVTADKGAVKLSPEEFHKMVSEENVILFDARNNFESAIGKFRNAVTPDIEHFRELPKALDEYEDLKDKKIVTYCTGGIRCEKASALMKQKGFKDVYQLEGGIIKYGQQYPDGYFQGKCFVFDERMSVAFTDNPQVLGSCIHCEEATDSYLNCGDPNCNKLILVCDSCQAKTHFCSKECESELSQSAT